MKMDSIPPVPETPQIQLICEGCGRDLNREKHTWGCIVGKIVLTGMLGIAILLYLMVVIIVILKAAGIAVDVIM